MPRFGKWTGWLIILIVVFLAGLLFQVTNSDPTAEKKNTHTVTSAELADINNGYIQVKWGPQPILKALKKLDLPAENLFRQHKDIYCHRKIAQDAEKIIIRNDLRAYACFAYPGEFSVHGEHPLGLALTLYPNKTARDWQSMFKLARGFGWRGSCNQEFCTKRLAKKKSPMRAVAFFPCGNPQPYDFNWKKQLPCIEFLHLSWNHEPVAPFGVVKNVPRVPKQMLG